jgi:hypothetical protein
MNTSLVTADGATHVKIVIVALLTAIVVVWIGIGANMNSGKVLLDGPRFDTHLPKLSVRR